MNQSETIGKLALALSKAQSIMDFAEKSAQNPHLRNKYADLTSVWVACREPLATNGLAVSQLPTSRIDDNGMPIIGLTCILMHESGEWVSTYMESPAVGNKGVNDLQAAGSVITYMRRYTLSAIVGVATGDDDDGNAGQQTRQQSQPQQRQAVTKPVTQKPDYSKENIWAGPDVDPAGNHGVLVPGNSGWDDLQSASAEKSQPLQGRELLEQKAKGAITGHDMTPANPATVAMWRERVEKGHRLSAKAIAEIVARIVPYYDNEHHALSSSKYDNKTVFTDNGPALEMFDALVELAEFKIASAGNGT